MSFRSKIYIPFASLVLFGVLPSCTDDESGIINTDANEIVVATSINGGSTSTRAVATVTDYVGRGIDVQNSKDKDFESGDKIKLTLIKRSSASIDRFTYKDVDFLNTAGSWDRVTSNPEAEDRIYWSDANNPHTFIGYSLPIVARVSGDGNAFEDKWKYVTSTESETIFYSCIGDPGNENEIIDFTSEYNNDKTEAVNGNSKIKKEDLLLTYNTAQLAEPGGSVAKLIFRHALANVRVIVNIRGFAATSDALDTRTRVSDLMLKNMPMMYKWRQKSDQAEPLAESDASAMTSFNWNKDLKKDIKTWMPHPEGVGYDVDRTFTFYALAVPGTTDLVMPFKVTYPKPLNPTESDTKDYEASIDNVLLKAGYCTTINISLNHSDEEMTVGATYIDWEFVEIPDRGMLRKNSVFLEDTDRSKITIVGDKLATNYDAIWLYNELNADGTPKTDANGKQIIKDIYGHTGDSEADAYQISTAQQFLSFAYEVQGKERGSENGSTLSGGIDFTGKYIKLDADIYLQESRNSDALSWEGIGDATHAFNGTFLGGGRIISRLKGNTLFENLGEDAVVDNLTLQDIIDIGSDEGALANVNNGKIIGCKISSNVKSTSSNCIGSIAGINNGTIEASYHIGDIEGEGAVAGLVGQNAGSIIGCYNAGAIKSTGTGSNIYGVTNVISSGTLNYCFYNKSLAGDLSDCEGKTTSYMQKEDFVFDLNEAFDSSSKYSYVFKPTMYPSLAPYSEGSKSILKSGYYRVRNAGSKRYVYVTDNRGSITTSSEDLGAIVLKSDQGFSDPGSIIYVKNISDNEFNLYSQGTSVYDVISNNGTQTGYYVSINKRDGYYRVGATDGSFAKYLADITLGTSGNGSVGTHAENIENKNYLLWDAIPVDETNYFGLNPSVTVGSSYYAPFFADFGFTVPTGMEVYYISQMNESDGKVCLKPITGIVPAQTPVIVKCKSSSVSENRLNLTYNNSKFASRNFLKGNMFNNTVAGHVNHTAYDPNTMRVLEVTSDGKLAFVKKNTSDLAYLPANQSYLVVSSSAPDIIYVETEDTYNENSSGSNNLPIATGYYRVQNFGSKSYLSVIDDKVTINMQDVNVTHDLGALALSVLDNSDPGSILYITNNGDITSQGVSLKSKIPTFTINERKIDTQTHYRVGATQSGFSLYIGDNEGKVDTHVGSDKNYLLWDAISVSDFVIKASITASAGEGAGDYAPFYAEFGYTVSDGMEVYYVSNIENNTVHLTKLTGTIPNSTPVIIKCKSANAAENKLTLKYSDSSISGNKLSGNMLNTSITGHENQTQVTANMRVLSVDNGNLVFRKPTPGSYLPANQSYLIVDTAEEALSVVFDN